MGQITPNSTRQVEIFSVGCPLCTQVRQLIEQVGSGFCDILVHDVKDEEVAMRARALGLRSFPAVVVDGKAVSLDLVTAFSQTFAESGWIERFLSAS